MVAAHFKILVIDSNREHLDATAAALREEGFPVITSSDAHEAIHFAGEELPELVLVDLQMPGLDGIEICIELRGMETLAGALIVFHTERNEDYLQVAAFNAGADDYIIRPVRPRVLVTRLKALLKRHSAHTSPVKKRVAGITVDRERYLIFRDGEEIVLPRKQFELIALLSTAPRKVFTRSEISRLIWGYEIFSKNRTIDVHIRKLREKIGDRYIKTIKGIGYSLEI